MTEELASLLLWAIFWGLMIGAAFVVSPFMGIPMTIVGILGLRRNS